MIPPHRGPLALTLAIAVAIAGAACADSSPQGDAPGQRAQPVIGGDPVEPGEFPATGALVVENPNEPGELLVWCTGTLVAPEVVLTAAHCVDETFLGEIVPGFTLEIDGNTVTADQVTPGRTKARHPQFDIFSTPDPGVGRWYDIGLLVLAEPVEGVACERLPTVAEATDALVDDAPLSLVGYGLTDQEAQALGVKTKGVGTLVEAGEFELFISRPGEQQNCNGDSGGPALAELPGGGRRLVGIVSRSPDDDEVCDHGGIDTRVDPYLDWIDTTLEELGSGVPHPPDAGADTTGSDAGFGADDDGGGCGCNSADGRGGAVWLGLLLLLAGAARIARRRRVV